ncbi:MAG: hypothetical protein WBM04_15790 [Candidatus Korobacteraceae bacterium]
MFEGAQFKNLIRRSLWLGMALLVIGAAAAAAETDAVPVPCPAATELSGKDIVARLMSRNTERARELRSFQSIRQYQLNYIGFPSSLGAEMRVKVTYTAPGTREFKIESESGSKLILNQVLHRLLESEKDSNSDEAGRNAMAVSTANYSFSLLGCAAADSRTLYVMRAEPLHDRKYLYRGRVWIDATDFAVTRIEAEPAKNPSFWTKRAAIHHEYEKIDGFYLPVLNQTVSDVRLGGKAVLTIRYLDYQVTAAGRQ